MKHTQLWMSILAIIVIPISTFSQDYRLPLYADKVPNSIETDKPERIRKDYIVCIDYVKDPDITVYLPCNKYATGQAVIVCPGGSYWVLAYDLEGTDVAKYLNSIGVAAIVLKYRLPVYGNCKIPHQAPLMDAQRAMRLVRHNASKWNINPSKIGIMGFSAGGHLASTLGTHFDYGNKLAKDSVEMESCRPDFMALVYPVISFTDSCTHKGTREALLGKKPDKNLIANFSNELQVKSDTPPTFLVTADDDSAVPSENSILMYRALKAKKISTELHIISEGEHGFGLGLSNEHQSSWTRNLKLWLNWLNSKK